MQKNAGGFNNSYCTFNDDKFCGIQKVTLNKSRIIHYDLKGFWRAANEFDGKNSGPRCSAGGLSFLKFCFHIFFKFLTLQLVKLLLMNLAKA